MTRLFSTSTIFILLFSLTSFAQDTKDPFTLPEITRPSPTVAQLMKFEEVNLSHYTGQPNIAIPLFSKNINGLNYNLALQYQVSGIRVDEQSGWVGKGWALETGGVISRSVVGLPDDINSSSLGLVGLNHTPFYDLSVDEVINGVTNTVVNHDMGYYFNSLWAKNYNYDNQRDIYQFNFFGNTGRFIFVKDSNNNLVPKIIGNDSKLKIDVDYEPGDGDNYPEVIKSFTVTDTNGFIYTFDQIETTEKQNTNAVYYRGNPVPQGTVETLPVFRSAWKLSEVKTLNDSVLVSFSYKPFIETPKPILSRRTFIQQVDCSLGLELLSIQNNPLNNSGAQGRMPADSFDDFMNGIANNLGYAGDEFFYKLLYALHTSTPMPQYNDLSLGGGANSNQCGWRVSCNPGAYEPISRISKSDISINSIKLDSVKFLRDEVLINFSSSPDHPEYVGKKLDYINISSGNGDYKTYRFKYNDAMLSLGGLLFLDEIEVEVPNTAEKQFYQFNYENLLSLQPYQMTPRDDFGYFKSDDITLYKERVSTGALTSITYPTGGNKRFTWESNTYSYKGDRLLYFSEIFENPDNYTIEYENLLYTGQGFSFDENQNQIPLIQNLTFNVSPSATLTIDHSITGISPYESTTGQGLYHYSVKFIPVNSDGSRDYTRDIVGFGNHSINSQGKSKVNFNSGSYRVSEVFTQYLEEYSDFTLTMNIQHKRLNDGHLNWWLYGGGVRIKSIEDIDRIGKELITTLDYDLEPTAIENYLTGIPLLSYPDTPSYPNSSNMTHYFSSGSLDGESKLTRDYVYSKEINDFPTSEKAYYIATEHQNELSAQLTQGSFIGYKNIKEQKGVNRANQNSAIKYEFDSPIDHPTFPEPYFYPFPPVEERDYLRGNLRKKTVLNGSNQKLTETINSYNYDNNTNIEVPVAQKLHFILNENNFSNIDNLIKTSYNDFNSLENNFPDNIATNCDGTLIVNQFLKPSSPNTPEIPNPPIFYAENITTSIAEFTNEYSYKVHLTATDTKNYFYDEQTDEASSVITFQTFDYSPSNYQIKEENTFFKVKGIDEHYKTKYFYPYDSGNYGSVETSKLGVQNKINTILATESFKNGELIGTVKNNFQTFDYGDTDSSLDDLVMLNNVQSLKSNETDTNEFQNRIVYDKYDTHGNPLEVSKTDGIHIMYVWGYKNTLPIAKIEGYSYSDVSTSLQSLIDTVILASNNDINDVSEEALRLSLNSLRNHIDLSKAMVSTYTYDPLIGITSTTDPRGYTVHYSYDDFSRLEYVRDQDDNILSKNEYNYRTTQQN